MSFSDHDCEELIEDFPEAVFLEDFDGNILDVNSQACRLLGYKKDELVGMTVDDIVPEGAPAFLPEQIDETTSKDNRLETKNITKDGSTIPVELRGRVIQIEEKNRIIVSLRDISERKRTREKYKILTEGSSQAIYLFQGGTFKYINDAFADISGYSRSELRKMDYVDLIHPDFKDRIKTWTRQAMTGDSSGLPQRVEYKIRTKDGETRWLRTLPSTIEYQGKPAIVGNAVDITEEKNLAKRLTWYKMAVEGSDDPIAACDKNYDYLFANKAYRRFYKLNKGDIPGKSLGDVLPEDKMEDEIMPRIDRCLEGERIEYKMKRDHPETGTRTLKITYYPLRSKEEIHGIVALMQDITEQKRAQQIINEERYKLRKLHEALDTLQHETTEEDLLDKTVELAENILDFEICAISMVDSDYLVPKANSTRLKPEETKTFEIGEGIAGKTVQKGETIWGGNVKDRPDAQPANDSFKAFISVPIGDLGNFQVVSKEAKSFDKQDVELAEILVNHLHEEVKRVRLEEQLRQKALSIQATKDKLESLHRTARKLESASEEKEVYRLGVDAAVDTLDFLLCSFSIARGETFEVKATSSEHPFDWVHRDLSVNEGISGKTYKTGETFIYDDVRKVDEAKPARTEYRSLISAPVGDIGVFQVLSENVGDFSKEDARLAELLAGHVYEAIKRIELETELKEQAIRDHLTGLYNRRYFTENLSQEVKRSERYDSPIAFLMIDINRFKEINDRYSHQKGDRVLKEIADLLQDNMRASDTVVRYGGDEFLIMMPETNGGVEEIVARLQEELDKWNDKTSLIDFPVSLAMGISHWTPYQGRGVEAALKEADRKMYRDKGR